ncbi:MAG: crotonase/enoyl-CoA hydratase family protein [Pseudomonadota bacterium]
MNFKHVIYQPDNDIVTISIDRPDCRNAVDPATARELKQAFLRFDEDKQLKVAVFTGTRGTFCAGADLKAVAGNSLDVNDVQLGPMGPSSLLLSKPVIAAIEGHAVAGGLELAMWCDLRVAAHDAVFGVFCRRWGVPLVDGGTIRLSRSLGHSHALDLILTGRPVSGDEAQRMGLANRLVEPGTALEHSQQLAGQIAAFPQQCMRADRLSSYQQWDKPFEQAFVDEFEGGLEVIRSGETLDGASRFASGAGRHGQFD